MKTVIVHGNCNCDYYANRLKESIDPGTFIIHHFVNHTYEPIPENVLKRCDYYIYQWLDEKSWKNYASVHFINKLPAKAKTLRVPIFSFLPFWPFHTARDDKYHRTADYPYGFYPYGDTAINAIKKHYNDIDIIVEEYLAKNLAMEVNLDKMMDENYTYYTNDSNALDINVYDTLMRNLDKEFLFHTINHPSDILLEFVLEQIFDFIGISCRKRSLKKFDSMFDFFQVPIHPSIAKYFNLSFAGGKQLYNVYWKKVTIREYFKGYLMDMPVHDYERINMLNFRQYNPSLFKEV